MKLKLMVVGRTEGGWISDGCDQYARRIVHYLPFTLEVVPDIRGAGGLGPAQLRRKEAEKVLERLGPDDRLILMDERGRTYPSLEFASLLSKAALEGVRSMVFLIAGAYGADESLKARADQVMSLSPMTFPHQLVRVLFLEQLYRACTINKGEKYHNEG
ncbi:MAG TPA: 23S rRNA (pseudouridine(1915)-N(3))-methyltransferase RlmH [Bacteroidales bacterium]|nr:23S rRNA (pseudouridine(1915)-N(3))-methyltransferase RlmH [Bacteroidales bacterium]